MNQKLLRLQLIGCAMLGVGLLAEAGYHQYADSQLRATLDKPAESDFQAEDLPELSNPTEDLGQYAEITERPLFIEGRRPIVEEAVKEAPAPVEVGQIDDWQLIGVYSRAKQPMALFRNQKEAKKFLKLNQHQTISGWQLQQIDPDRVTLQQGSQQKIVPLRKPRAQMPAKNGPIPPAPPKPIRPGVPPNASPAPAPAAPAPMPATNNPLENSDDETE